MALQGTLDTFALPDVLRLLASTKKSGRLRVSGNRGTGSVWVDGGGVVAAEATGLPEGPRPVDVMFELLRYGEGSFTFEAGTGAPNPAEPRDVEPLLGEAEHQLSEWRAIEAVVPSMEAWVTLATKLPQTEVVVDGDRWRTIVTVGSGTSVAAVGRALGLGEVAVCRMIKDLVEVGLGSVTAAPAPATPSVAEAQAERRRTPSPAPAGRKPMPEPVAPSESVVSESAPSIDLDDRASENGFGDLAPFSIEIPGVEDRTPAASAAVVEPASNGNGNGNGHVASSRNRDATDAAEADEVARQLASLSPKAARAVAAAARAETDEEREAALAEVTGDDDEPINRGLLLKFLSSVRS